jgi:tetratricopeptide (TPR) repeat protein
MQPRFEELMAGYLEDRLTPAERAELVSLVQGSEASRRLAARDRLVDRLLRESRKAPLNSDIILQAISRQPSDLAARTMAELDQRQPLALPVAQRVQGKIRSLRRWLMNAQWRPWALPIGVALAAIAVGLLWFQGPSRTQVEIGKFTTVLGMPTSRQAARTKPLNSQRSTPIHLGDRIETGDADKAEIQFNDGTTLRLSFNTTLEISNLKSRISNPKSAPVRPAEVKLLAGQIWTKVTKATNPTPFAVSTPVATAAVKGTEFGVKLEKSEGGGRRAEDGGRRTEGGGRASATTNAAPAISPSGSPGSLVAVLTVKEGAVEFSNSFGRVQATAMTESLVEAGSAPTEPKRLQSLQVFRLTGSHTWTVTTMPLSWPEAAQRLVYPAGYTGLRVFDFPPTNQTSVAGVRPGTNEVRVVSVKQRSPAALAGIQAGDVVIAINGRSVSAARELENLIALEANQQITLGVLRAGQTSNVTLSTTRAGSAVPGPDLPPRSQARLSAATRLAVQGPSDEGPRALARLTSGRLGAAAQNNLGVLFELQDQFGPAIRAYDAARRADPYVPLYHFNLGLALRKIGNFDRAAEELEWVRRLAPQSVEAHERLGELYALLGHANKALDLAESALKLDPQSHGAWELKSQLYLKQLRPKEALEAALKAIELDPACGVAYGQLAAVCLDQRQLDEAEKFYRKAIELEPSHALLHLNLGNVYHDRQQLAEAETSYRKAIGLRPDLALAYHNLGNVLADRRQPDQAIQALRKALELDPEDAEAYYGLGEVYRTRRQYSQAEQMYRKAAELKPESAPAQTGLGLVCYERRQFDDAEKLYRKAIELDPTGAAPYHDLGELYREVRGQLDEAEKFYRQAIKLEPDDPDPYNGLGLLMFDRGNLAEAERMLRRALALQPDSSAFNNNLGELYRRRGQLDQAERLYQKALELDPSNVSPYGNLGIIYSMRREFAAAEKMFRAVLERAPESAKLPSYVNLAGVLGAQGKLDEAEKLLRQALATSPKNPNICNSLAYFLADHSLKLDEALALARLATGAQPNENNFDTLGWVHFQRGELAEAEATLKKALALAGENAPVPDIREHLKKVQERRNQPRPNK